VYSMPVDVTFWGRSDTKAEVLKIIRQSGCMIYEGMSCFPANSTAASFSNKSQVLNVQARRTFLNPTEVINLMNAICNKFVSYL